MTSESWEPQDEHSSVVSSVPSGYTAAHSCVQMKHFTRDVNHFPPAALR